MNCTPDTWPISNIQSVVYNNKLGNADEYWKNLGSYLSMSPNWGGEAALSSSSCLRSFKRSLFSSSRVFGTLTGNVKSQWMVRGSTKWIFFLWTLTGQSDHDSCSSRKSDHLGNLISNLRWWMGASRKCFDITTCHKLDTATAIIGMLCLDLLRDLPSSIFHASIHPGQRTVLVRSTCCSNE